MDPTVANESNVITIRDFALASVSNTVAKKKSLSGTHRGRLQRFPSSSTPILTVIATH